MIRVLGLKKYSTGHKGRNAISLKSVAMYEEKVAMSVLSRVWWWCMKKTQQCPFSQESGSVWRKGSNALSLKSLVAYEESGRLSSWSQCFLFPSVLQHCWLKDRRGIWPTRKACHLMPEVLFLNKWRKRTKVELGNPSSPEKTDTN